MLRSVNALIGEKVSATDGDAGKVRDLLFDDEKWVLRYLVVDCGGWLSRDEVLVSPIAVRDPWTEEDGIRINLSLDQLERSPRIDSRRPVSRRLELEYHRYYNWPNYWNYPGLWATGPYGQSWLPPRATGDSIDTQCESQEVSHLRSIREVTGYRIHGKDKTFGHIEDFIMDDETWSLRYLVVNTRNWLPSRSVLIASQWVDDIRWVEREVHVPFSPETIRNAPSYEPEALNNEDVSSPEYPHEDEDEDRSA